MKKEDIIRKLTSRKLWVALIGFITPLMISFGYSESTVTQFASIIMAGGTLIAYIIGEGMVDSESVASKNATEEDNKSVYTETSAIGFTVDDEPIDEDEE